MTLNMIHLFYSLWCREKNSKKRYGPDNIFKYYEDDVKKQNILLCKKRSVPIDSFVDKNLLSISQGNKGKWV